LRQVEWPQFDPGRCLAGRLPDGEDLCRSIAAICASTGIITARFSVMGVVSSVTVGAFDETQQVYVTDAQTGVREIVSCTGVISVQQGRPDVRGQILVSDTRGELTGGRLFSETTVFAAEMEMMEMKGPPLSRAYDETTGLWRWP
jgi:uncharacterized protein